MSTPTTRVYEPDDTETALKYALTHLHDKGVRAELIEGEIEIMAPTWDHEQVVDILRDGLVTRAAELKCVKGSGDLDLPGSPNWYQPDIAIIPKEAARGARALPVTEALLVVEVTSESNAATDRVVKRRRYGQYQVPLYLLVDRVDRTWTLFSEPDQEGYGTQDGPYPFGTSISLPDPFNISLDTAEF